jgi:hypothetical protein
MWGAAPRHNSAPLLLGRYECLFSRAWVTDAVPQATTTTLSEPRADWTSVRRAVSSALGVAISTKRGVPK